jgi:hypothetical protein
MITERETQAAKVLEIDAGADTRAARNALLSHLESEDWRPAENRIAAWNYWAEHPLKLTKEAEFELRKHSAAELDAFVSKFWELEPETRREQWQLLWEQNRYGRNAVLLNRLQRGVAVGCTTKHPDRRVSELAAVLRELFLLPPRERSLRRNQWLDTIPNRSEWTEVVRTLRGIDPRLPALDTVLVDWIERYGNVELKVQATASMRKPKGDSVDYNSRMFASSSEVLRRAADAGREQNGNSESFLKGFSAVGFVAVWIVIALLRACNSSTDTKSNYTPPRGPVVAPYTGFKLPEPFGVKPRFTDAELLAFYDFVPNSGRPMPPRYTTFMLTGGADVLETLRQDSSKVARMRRENPWVTLPTYKFLTRPSRLQP